VGMVKQSVTVGKQNVINTPGNVSLLVSVTVPLMLIVCACNTLAKKMAINNITTLEEPLPTRVMKHCQVYL